MNITEQENAVAHAEVGVPHGADEVGFSMWLILGRDMRYDVYQRIASFIDILGLVDYDA